MNRVLTSLGLFGRDESRPYIDPLFSYFSILFYHFTMIRKLNLPRRKVCRLSYWHYAQKRAYFITILTSSRWRFFGEFQGKKPVLSTCGILAGRIWSDIPNYFPFVQLDAYVIMPDHLHGILIVKEKFNFYTAVNTVPERGGITGHHNPMLHHNISKVVRWFKGRSTFEIRKIRKDFKWHPRFYDRILRKSELKAIRQYIKSNPEDWQKWL